MISIVYAYIVDLVLSSNLDLDLKIPEPVTLLNSIGCTLVDRSPEGRGVYLLRISGINSETWDGYSALNWRGDSEAARTCREGKIAIGGTPACHGMAREPGNSRDIGMSFRMRPRKSSRKAVRQCLELHSGPTLEKEQVSTGRFTNA